MKNFIANLPFIFSIVFTDIAKKLQRTSIELHIRFKTTVGLQALELRKTMELIVKQAQQEAQMQQLDQQESSKLARAVHAKVDAPIPKEVTNVVLFGKKKGVKDESKS